MGTLLLTVPKQDIAVDRDGPAPFDWYQSDSSDTPVARAATLVCVITDGTNTVTKTVGGGITLSTQDAVANALVTLQLTTADLEDFQTGNFQSYEFREGASDPKRTLLKGRLVIE